MSTLDPQKNESVNLAALDVPQMVDILAKAGAKDVTEEQVQQDIKDGAPVDAEGKLNLLAYTAWLARSAQHAGH